MRKNYDMSKARLVRDIPQLAALQAAASRKTRITIMLDADVIQAYRQRAQDSGTGYQTEINRALKDSLNEGRLSPASLRSIIRDELSQATVKLARRQHASH